MRILIVSPFRFAAVGGVASAVRFLGGEFAAQGHEVTVVARGGTNTPVDAAGGGACAVYSVGLRDLGAERVGHGAIGSARSAVACLCWLPVSLWGLGRLLRRVKPDVVFIQYPRPRMFGFVLLRWMFRWKLVLTFQGSDAHQLANYTAVSRALMRWLVRGADRVTAVSQSLVEHVHAATGLPQSSMVVVPNGTPAVGEDVDVSLPPLPRRFVVTAGKLIRRKGVDVLIRAIGQLRREGCDVPVVVAGEGEERLNLAELAAAEQVGDLFQFVGELDHPSTLAAMGRADLFVLASRAEGMPLVLAEAMACGTPVVATDVDGAREIIPDDRFGLLVEAEDANSLAIALRRLWSDGALRSSISRAGEARARSEYRWGVIAEKYLAEFDAVTEPVETLAEAASTQTRTVEQVRS